jgi:predicted amidophosphoribosyltransferase
MADALFSCPDCARQISTRAHQCPHCGRPLMPNGLVWQNIFKWVFGIIMGLLLALLLALI